MAPVLLLVVAAGVAWSVLCWTTGSSRWLLLAAVVGTSLAVWVVAVVHLRRQPHFPLPATVAVLAVYALTPIVLPLAVGRGVSVSGGIGMEFVKLPLLFAGAFGLTLLVTTYGLGTLVRLSLRHAAQDLRNSVHLLGRALPVMLFVTLFLFFTAELWQAMNRISWLRLALIVLLFGAVTVLAAAARLRDDVGRVEQDLSVPRLASACRGTPLAEVSFSHLDPASRLHPVPLAGKQKRNLLFALAARQLVQAAVVGFALFVFFIVLGLLVVTPDTAAQWIGSDPVHLDLVPFVPAAMVRNAIVFAAFGSMYFEIVSMTDAEHREQFFSEIIEAIERILVVRAVYLAAETGELAASQQVDVV